MGDECVFKQDVILAIVEKGQASKRYKLGETWELNLKEISEAVGDMKPADVRPVVRGEWECGAQDFQTGYTHTCSVCGGFINMYVGGAEDDYNFCPNCGADMRGEGTDFSAPLKMTTGEGNGDQSGETPNCMNCGHRKDRVVDDFPVCECPFIGNIPKPLTTCCEQYILRVREMEVVAE